MNLEEIKAKSGELAWWSVKWVVVAVIMVMAVQIYERLNRHNLLVDAILNNFQQIERARYERQLMRDKAVQELPGPDDPVPTEDRKR